MTYAINEPIAAANFPYLKNLEENARLHPGGKRENLVEKFKLGTFLRVATTIPSIISLRAQHRIININPFPRFVTSH